MDIKPDRHINLVLIGKGENRHYCLIKNFSGLMSYQTKHQGRKHYCYNCLHGFAFKETLGQHIEQCYKQKTPVFAQARGQGSQFQEHQEAATNVIHHLC